MSKLQGTRLGEFASGGFKIEGQADLIKDWGITELPRVAMGAGTAVGSITRTGPKPGGPS